MVLTGCVESWWNVTDRGGGVWGCVCVEEWRYGPVCVCVCVCVWSTGGLVPTVCVCVCVCVCVWSIGGMALSVCVV
jgi:hypothetical protein